MPGDDEPTVELDEYAKAYLLLRLKRKEKQRLDAEVERLEQEFRELVGSAHVAKIDGQEVITNRPIKTFRGREFRDDHPILAKTYTNMVEKPVLDLEGLERDHPTLFREYQSRQFRILDIE